MKEQMGRRDFLKAAGVTAVAASVSALGLLTSERAYAATTQRSFQEYLDSQRQFVSWVPPIYDFWGWYNNDPINRAVSVDYFGFAEEWFQQQTGGAFSIGTTVDGTVSERPLKDGRALVTVEIHTKNALAWAIPLPGPDPDLPYRNNPLLFGYRAPEVLAGATPALGEVQTQWEFTNVAPGAPFPLLGLPDPTVYPDVVWPDYLELRSVKFRSNAVGPLRELSGLGPEGTPGRCICTQTGIFMASGKGATADGYPAERVELRVIGG